MTEENKDMKKLDDAQIASVAVSVTVIVFFVVYWAIQIQSVRDLLKLAYG